MPVAARLLSREVLPFMGSFAALALLSLALDGLLHRFELLWVGRWLGIPGTLLIIGSTAYSLRKRKLIHFSQPAKMLRWHGSGRCWCSCTRVFISTPSWAGSRSGQCSSMLAAG